MMTKTTKILAILFITGLFFTTVTAWAEQLRKVEANKVCMVNNVYMERPQIPVKVDKQTYYGCCDMCAGTLNRDRSARFSTDPVSGKEVDKAKAVIGAKPNNEVLYFENENNFKAFASQ
jgi:YHS domain-containing protein